MRGLVGVCFAFALRGGRLARNMINCCETTSKVAVSRKALRPPKDTFLSTDGAAHGMRATLKNLDS
jgi:hypothetical protein